MDRQPKAGEPYQLCKHLAAAAAPEARHVWSVPGRDAWIVLCAECHKRIAHRIAAALAPEVGHFAPSPTTATAQPVAPLDAWQPVVEKLAEGLRAVALGWSERAQQEAQRQERAAACQQAQQQMDALNALVSEQIKTITNLQAIALDRERAITDTLRSVSEDLIPPRRRRPRK